MASVAGRDVLSLVFLGALGMTALGAAAPAQAQGDPRRVWEPTISAEMGYGDYAGGASASQTVSLQLAQPDRFWRFSAGHHRLMGEEGYSTGLYYQQSWQQRFRLGGGFGTGTNRSGGLAPKYHVSVMAGMTVVDPLLASVSYSRRRSARDATTVDRYGIGATWYAPGPWIVGANTTYSVGRPGSTHSWSSGGGITYSVWRLWSLGVRVDHGDGSYLLLPSQSIVEFESWSYSANYSRYLTAETSVRVSIGYSEYYRGPNLGFGVSKRW